MIKFRTNGKWRMLILLAIAVVFRLNVTLPALEAAPGNIYYVSKTGNNADGRSWATAWNELDQIDWGVIQPGDVILIDGGAIVCPATCVNFPECVDYSGDSCGMVYNTPLVVNANGTQDNPITIKLASESGKNGTVVIDGGVVGSVYCEGYGDPETGETWEFPHYTIPQSGGRINGTGISLQSDWIVVDGTKWGGIEIRNHSFTGLSFQGNHLTARYLKIHHTRDDGQWTCGVTLNYGADYNTLSHSEIFANGQDGIHLHGENFTVEYNYFHHHHCSHADCVQSYKPYNVPTPFQMDNLIFRYNIFEDFGPILPPTSLHGLGIYIGSQSSTYESWGNNVQIHDNLFIDQGSTVFITDNANTTNFDIHHNTIVRAGGYGVNFMGVGAKAPMAVHDNIFYDVGWKISPRGGLYMPTNGGKTAFTNNCLYLCGPVYGDFDESGTIKLDPMFIDPANGDYALSSDSPCLGKGSSITSVDQLLGQPAPTPIPVPPAPTPWVIYLPVVAG